MGSSARRAATTVRPMAPAARRVAYLAQQSASSATRAARQLGIRRRATASGGISSAYGSSAGERRLVRRHRRHRAGDPEIAWRSASTRFRRQQLGGVGRGSNDGGVANVVPVGAGRRAAYYQWRRRSPAPTPSMLAADAFGKNFPSSATTLATSPSQLRPVRHARGRIRSDGNGTKGATWHAGDGERSPKHGSRQRQHCERQWWHGSLRNSMANGEASTAAGNPSVASGVNSSAVGVLSIASGGTAWPWYGQRRKWNK